MRAGCFAAVADDVDLAAVDDDFGADDGVWLARGQAKPGNARDAGQSFAAKAEGGDGGEVGGVSDLAGGVTFERKERIVALHSTAIVYYPDDGNAAAPNQDVDLACAGVDAVFHQLFDHRSGTFHHFAGRDLTGDDLWEQANPAHLIANCRLPIADCEIDSVARLTWFGRVVL